MNETRRLSRTDEAIAWINAAPAGETRTQQQAAALFGIAQATIAGAIGRSRSKCPACGQTLKPGIVVEVGQVDGDLRAKLAHVVNTYAWHRSDCASGEGGACTCGFEELERSV